jgi:pSer/pThr/pTyr-binding forkhead associated (FHA) protein
MPQSASELADELQAEREGWPFVAYRDESGGRHIIALDGSIPTLSVGRRSECAVAIPWDPEVSRAHAEIQRNGADWIVNDVGLSSNGSFVNGQRLLGSRRLLDGDVLRFGSTVVLFRAPCQGRSSATAEAPRVPRAEDLSETQARIAQALCQPFAESTAFRTPPTNEEIATELFLSVDAVKKNLRTMFFKFGVEELPQTQKRLRLAERMLATGVVSLRRE